MARCQSPGCEAEAPQGQYYCAEHEANGPKKLPYVAEQV
jgi:hypothetical protein